MAADPPDAGMDTCPSPEIGDSRKRPLESDTENGSTKRSHFSSGKYVSSRVNCNNSALSAALFFIYLSKRVHFKKLSVCAPRAKKKSKTPPTHFQCSSYYNPYIISTFHKLQKKSLFLFLNNCFTEIIFNHSSAEHFTIIILLIYIYHVLN